MTTTNKNSLFDGSVEGATQNITKLFNVNWGAEIDRHRPPTALSLTLAAIKKSNRN